MKKVLLFILIFFSFSFVQAKNINIYLFHNESCTHCQAEIEFLEELSKTREITLYKYEVSQSSDNQKILTEVRDLFQNKENLVPFTIIGSETFTGFSSVTKSKILETIDYYDQNDYCDKTGVYLKKVPACEVSDSKDTSSEFDLPIIGKVDAKKFSLPIISVVIGLVDGFNPCAMWVLIFLLSMLINMKDRKKMWILGLTFIVTSALVYTLIMFAWLNIMVNLTTVRWLQLIIAAIALVAGGINLISYFKSLKKDDGCMVTTDDSRKKTISKIKRIVTLEEESENKKKFAFLAAILGIIALAISVNVIELACSAGLPLIFTQILAMNNVSMLARAIYILIYILFFMIDDIIVFIIAMATFKITGISTKYTKYSHLIGGIIMLIIGILMIFKPSLIMFNF